ncbi:MAG: hypothetical protein RIR39_1884 [Pseudomonadota bacterium]
MLFVPDIFALERTNGIGNPLDILILTVECWATKKCRPTYMTNTDIFVLTKVDSHFM